MIYRIFNASNVLGFIAFLAILFAPGAWEGAIENDGPYIVPVLITIAIAVCAYFSMKEDGKKK